MIFFNFDSLLGCISYLLFVVVGIFFISIVAFKDDLIKLRGMERAKLILTNFLLALVMIIPISLVFMYDHMHWGWNFIHNNEVFIIKN